MAAALIEGSQGAAFMAALGLLFDVVKKHKDKAVSFKSNLRSIATSLERLKPLVREIYQYDDRTLGLSKEEMEAFMREMEAGAKLVRKCSNISVQLNSFKKARYRGTLNELENTLARLESILQAQSMRDTKMLGTKVKKICDMLKERKKYDIFLNFRGEDTRFSFVSHLYNALKKKGLQVFRDDDKMVKGGYIHQELMEAIENSWFAVVVLSQNYASSKWCLRELAKIVECIGGGSSLRIIPIFYHVNPSDVQHVSGSYGNAFQIHEQCTASDLKSEEVEKWRHALKEVGKISGWDVHNKKDEVEFKVEFVTDISRRIDLLKKSSEDLNPSKDVYSGHDPSTKALSEKPNTTIIQRTPENGNFHNEEVKVSSDMTLALSNAAKPCEPETEEKP